MQLYLIFVKIGAILLGGGYVILPIITNEFSEKRELVSKEDVLDYFSLAQSLPGIIAANVSMFIGYKLRGKCGALVAMLGIVSAPFLCIVCLATILNSLVENQYIKVIFWGVGISVIALIILTVREILQNSKKDFYFYFIFMLTMLVLLVLKLSPIQAIVIVAILGVVYKSLIKKSEEN